ncbi:hypothetical protein PAMA_000809 [Pampus argenteus]
MEGRVVDLDGKTVLEVTEESLMKDLQTTAAVLKTNTSSSSRPLVSRIATSNPTSNLTSSISERTPNSRWTLSSDQSSVTTEPSSKISSTAASSIQSPTSQSSTTKSPTSQSTTTTTPASQSSTSTTPASQSSTTTSPVSQSTTTTTPASQSSTSTTPASQSSTTKSPDSQSSTTTTPASQSSTTTTPASQSSTSTTPASQSSTTKSPDSQSSTTTTPASQSSTATTPTSQSSTTITPASQSSTTTSPVSQILTTTTPASQSSTTKTQVNQSSTTKSPVSQSSNTKSPVSQSTTTTVPVQHSSTKTVLSSQSPTSKRPSSQSQTSTAPSSQLTTSTGPGSQSSLSSPASNQSSVSKTPTKTKPNQSPSSQTPLSQSSTSSNKSSIQSPTTLIIANQSISSSKTSHYTFSSFTSPNQSLSSSAPSDQSLTSSVILSNQSSSGSAVNGSFSPDERRVNTSQLSRQTKEALRSPIRQIPAEPCATPCLNGGQCVESESCDCSLYQATGHRCQTVPNPGFEREMTCRSWGQYNFETFDGLYYYFPGRCTYTLLKDCEETTQANIIVQVHNDPGCNSAPYTCQRSVSLFLPWEGILYISGSILSDIFARSYLYHCGFAISVSSLQLPHHIHDLQLEQISQYVLVTQQHGFTLAWEGRSGSVYIKLSPEFVGRTCGLCGNFNADVQDDLKTSYGVLTHEIEMFGNSWMESEPHLTRCPMVTSDFSSPCAAVDAHILLKVEEVCAMLLEPPFQSCHDFVSPLSYMASCSNDLCMSGPSGDVVCQVFSEYARACAHADHPLHDWRRRIPQCGLIYEDGSCVTPSDCPCEYHSMFYPSGQTLQEECNNCTCVGGVWNCTDYSCPGECSVTGDMYFQSFDGRIYTFPATCQYVLAKSRNPGKFTVTIQNAPCGANLDGACIQSVNLVVDEDSRTEITLSRVGEVFMAGQYRISLPYSDGNILIFYHLPTLFTSSARLLSYPADVFHIQELSSMFLQVKTAFGLRLQYSWTEFRLYLQADELWKDDTVGLCGTFNGNIQDDFLSPSGMIESTPQLFGNAWRISSACSPSLSTPQLDPCDTHQQAVSYASEMCDVLNQELFSACHEYLSPTPFHQQCRSDTCKCGTPCLCSALAHYARHCRRFSVIVDFRSHILDCAVTCPATMQYGTCVSSCQRRCSALSVPQHCGEECEEGCVCPQGSFYNHRTHTCVHRSECPCSFLGADYEPGDVIMTSAGVQLCLNGKLVSQTSDGDRLCPPGQIYQNCSDGEDGLLPGRGVACERTCESYLLNLTCSTHEPCVAGCACPPGVCQHGTFQCVFHPCPSMCTAYGDRHYRTFDGLLFDYVGACKVYLIKSSADVMLSVSAENVDCFDGGVICRKSLLINIGRSVVAFDDDTGKPNPSSVVDRKQRMFIWPAGYFTVIHFPDEDVSVLWDRKTTVHIQVGPRWQVDVTWFYMNCLADTCACSRGGDCECFCTSVAAYAQRCCHQGVPVDWRSPSLCPYDCEFYNKVLGKGPFRLITFRDRTSLLAATRSTGSVFVQRGNLSAAAGVLSQFMMTPGLSTARPHDTSRVSFEAADRPNYFLYASASGQVRLAKWEDSKAFWDRATFVLHRDTWISGYDSLESHAKPGFFVHATLPRFHLLKYRHADSFRKATLFRLTGPGPDAQPAPRCQWRYDSCITPCFRTCSDPSAEACVTIPQVEGCLPVCPPHMVLDEVTRRCVYAEDCIKVPVAVKPVTPSGPQPTSSAVTSVTITSSVASTTHPSTTPTSSTPPHMAPTAKITTAVPAVSTQTTSSKSPPAPDEPTRPVSTSSSAAPELPRTTAPPPPPTAPPAVRPEVVEPLSTVKVTEAQPTAVTGTTDWTTSAVSSTISPFHPSTSRTSGAPFAITALFWLISSTRPTDSLKPLFTTTETTLQPSTTTAPTTSSIEGPTTITTLPAAVVQPTDETTKATTHSAAVTPIVTTSSLGPTPVSETSAVTDRTTVPKTTTTAYTDTTTAYTDTTTKPVTVERIPPTTTTPITPGLPSTASTTTSPLLTSSPVETVTVTLPTVTSAKTTESVTPVAPITTSKTTPYMIPETTMPPVAAVTTERMVHTTPTEPTTSTTTAPEIPTLTSTHVAPTTTAPPATSATTDWQTTTKKVTIPESTASKIPAATTTTAAPPPVKITDTTTAPAVSTTTTYTERTSWAATVPTTARTTQTTASRPSEIPETSTVPTGSPATTKPTVPPVSLTETTTVPLSPTAESSTSPVSTTRTSEPWHPPHRETSSTPVYSPTVKTTPELTSETVIHVVSSTETIEVPRLPATTKPVITSATSAAATTTTATTTVSHDEISTAEFTATTTRKAVTPQPPPIPGAPETLLTTIPTRAPPSVVTTTLRPVTVQPITEMTHPLTGRVEVSATTATTTPPPSWSPLDTTTSASTPRQTTFAEKVTTRLVSTTRATPPPTSTTITRTTTLRTTPRVPVTTRVTPRITSTSRSTIRPVTARVTVATRPPTVTVKSTTLGSPTVTPSPGTATVSTSTTIATSVQPVITVSPTERVDTTSATPGTTTTVTPDRVPVPTLTTVTVSTAVPTMATREPTTSEKAVTTKEAEASPSTSQPGTPPPDVLSSSQQPGILTPTTTSLPAATPVQTTTADTRDYTSPRATTPPAPASPYSPVETTRHTAEGTTSLAVSPTRMCTPPYAEIVDECTKYICVNNQLVLFNKSQNCPFTSDPPNCGLLGFAILINGDKCCPQWDCPCRCSMFPDLNVITFDGNSVAIYKAASYIVTQLPNETVSVQVQECPADSDSPLYVNSRYAKPRFKKFGFEIYDTGNMYLIRSPAGLKLQWYHSTGMMVIDTENSSNKLPTMGLCGFCDGDPTNDLTLANGTTVGRGEDPAVFIDSWQVPNTTSYISHSRRRELNCSTSDCSSCLVMLQNHPFSSCHAFVPPSTFCEVWVQDSEYVNNQCVALAAYVASCHKFNICIEWRSPDYCPFACPETLQYQACLPACTSQSCPNHDFDSDPDQCSGLTEGCVCPEGTLLHQPYSALCIPPDKCACTDSSGVPRAHGEVWKASKDACCMYRCDKDTIVPVEYNCSSVAAPVCRRTGEVIISLADDTSCCPHKVCVCNQTLCDLLPPECKYGEKLVSYYRQDSCCPDYVCECDPELCESDVPACREDQTLIATRADGSCCLAHICSQSKTKVNISSCPVGMSVMSVSSPGRCCPNQTCGTTHKTTENSKQCSCDKISSPKCNLGEAAQLDRAFLSDPQNQCACKRYKCDYIIVYLINRMFQNQIYIPPKDQSTCCGVCKNISCMYEHENGTTALYKVGGTVVSYMDGCCKTCKEDGKSCQKVTVRMTIRKNDCRSNRPVRLYAHVNTHTLLHSVLTVSVLQVNIVSCDGKCPSASIYNYNINTYARFSFQSRLAGWSEHTDDYMAQRVGTGRRENDTEP